MTLGDALRMVGAREQYLRNNGRLEDLGYSLLVFNDAELAHVEALAELVPGSLVTLRTGLSVAIGAYTEANTS